MIAMQYSIVLPADYDMTTIDRRIHDKGPMLDGFPLLKFKAYLSACKRDKDFSSLENLYAPFYLWENSEGMSSFLTSAGFANLTRDFGWPKVQTWAVWHTEYGQNLSGARFASRRVDIIPHHSDLSKLKSNAVKDARDAILDGALATLVAFDPTEWTFVEFALWADIPKKVSENQQLYRVGHVSEGETIPSISR